MKCALFAAVLSCIHVSQAGLFDVPIIAEGRIENCGAKVSMFVLEWFELPIEVSRFEESLDIGPIWAKATSLLNIKNLLQSSGLNVQAYKDANADEILSTLGKDEICVLHAHEPDPGHFYIVVKQQPGRFLFIDAAESLQILANDELKERLATEGFSGYCLFVSRPKAKLNAVK